MRRGLKLPSPAVVIAFIALVAAIGGGTFAIAKLNGNKVKEIARKQAKAVLRNKAPTLSVAHADTADNASTADVAGSAGSAYSAFHEGTVSCPVTLGPTTGTLEVPETGSYVITATFEAFNTSVTANPTSRFKLSAGDNIDERDIGIPGIGSVDHAQSVTLQVVHQFDSPGSVIFQCSDGDNGDVSAGLTRITAVQVANLSNVGF